MKNKTITRIMALSLGAALLFSGCTSKEKEPEATPTPAVESETPKDYSKYNTYLNLVEDIYELEEILGVYFDNVEYAAEFAVREGGDYANIKEATDFYTPMTYTVEQALDYAKEEPAYPDADAAMLTLGDSPAKVMKAVGDISNYMQFNDFEDDDLAKAPERHAALMAALETYDLYYGSFLTAMETLADETRDEDIQELLDAGEMILYYSRCVIRDSQDILNGIWAQLEDAAANTEPNAEFALPVIDMTEIDPLLAQFQENHRNLTGAMNDEAEREKVSTFTGTVGDSALKLYTNKVEMLAYRMTDLANALAAGTEYADAYDATSEAVSSMISGYNSIN